MFKFGMLKYNDKHAANIDNIVDQYWLCRYPRSTIITYNHGNEFLGHVFKKHLIKNIM